VNEESGIGFPAAGMKVERYTNKQGAESFQARLTYVGPYPMKRASQQRVKFDITQQEVLVGPVDRREIFHGYEDAIDPPPRIGCYSVHEILAEKARALYERQGRARDVYDVVHISRSFRDEISASSARKAVAAKFEFKQLAKPTAAEIMARIDWNVLQANWDQQLGHQLPKLPDLQGFQEELPDALLWWMEPSRAAAPLPNAPRRPSETVVPRSHFPRRLSPRLGFGRELPDPIRFAARNRLLAGFAYHGIARTVEPYSLRVRGTGDLLLYAFERSRGGSPTGQLKSYKVGEIAGARALAATFSPRWAVEL
jgi:hypothetical protein